MAQIKVNAKSHEITAIPELLDMLDIEGCTISIDAMGCRKDIASKIISEKADYILAVKDNQPTLRLDAPEYTGIPPLTSVGAKDFSRRIRSHWGIENQLRWVLDMAFNGDRSQKRAENFTENFSGMLRLARNILKRYKDLHPSRISYRSMMLRVALNPTFASEVIQAVFA